MYSLYEENWKKSINTSSKLNSYCLYKKYFLVEKYLNKSFNKRCNFSKLRVSAHILHSETGRHKKTKVPPEQRFCTFCSNLVENEFHFLLECNLYNQERNDFFNSVPSINDLTIGEKFVSLMSGNFEGTFRIC